MLVRCIGILSGMCTGLDPDFNLWEQLEPYARKLVEQEAASAFNAENILDQLGDMAKLLIALPSQASRVLAQAEAGGLMVRVPQVSQDLHRLGGSLDRLGAAVIFGALLIAGVMLLDGPYPAAAVGLLAASGISLLWILFGGRRRDT
jgi:predicted unusual protein kinase regulating ubiquinone biosynthesis (AarF/ABC1/UbiB family)